MQFLFDGEDIRSLPLAYDLIEDIKAYADKLRDIDVDEKDATDKKTAFSIFLKKMMVDYPQETSELFKKLWILEDGEKAPNVWVTMTTLFRSEVAIDFFTSVLPSVVQISKVVSSK